jgi:hypothetical protein
VAPVGIAVGDDDVAVANLFQGVLLVDKFVEGCEDCDFPSATFELLCVLEEHIEEGGVGQVDGFEEAFELSHCEDASAVEIDDFADAAAFLVSLQSLCELFLRELLQLGDFWDCGVGGCGMFCSQPGQD